MGVKELFELCMHVCAFIQVLEVQSQQADADLPTADTGFTMSTNTAYSTINTVEENVAHGTGLNDVISV